MKAKKRTRGINPTKAGRRTSKERRIEPRDGKARNSKVEKERKRRETSTRKRRIREKRKGKRKGKRKTRRIPT